MNYPDLSGMSPINRREALRVRPVRRGRPARRQPRCRACSSPPPRPRRKPSPSSRSGCGAGPRTSTPSTPSPTPATTTAARSITPIATNVSGIRIGELLPLLAKQADKYSIIRSMTHGINAHETASYTVQTGRSLGRARGLSQRRRGGLAVQGLQRRIQGTDPALHRADPAAGALLRSRLPGLALQAVRHRRRPGAGALRGGRRGGAGHHRPAAAGPPRATCTSSTRWPTRCPAIRSSLPPEEAEKQAYELILGDAGKVFDLRRRRTSCATATAGTPSGSPAWSARRLVERGVPYITINYKAAGTRTSRTSRPCAASCRRWTRAWRRCCRIFRTAACWTAPSSGGAANSAARPRCMWEAPWNGGRGH